MQIPKLASLTKRERTILSLCIGVILLSLLYNIIIEPVASRWIQLGNEVKIARLKLKKSSEILKRRLHIINQYEKLSSFIQLERGSDEEEIAILLSEVERLASSAGTRITDIKPGVSKGSGYFRKFIVEIESEGDIDKISKFIYEVQNSTHILKIEKLSINMKGTRDRSLKVNMLVTKLLP